MAMCKYCHAETHWKESQSGWRMYESDGSRHECPEGTTKLAPPPPKPAHLGPEFLGKRYIVGLSKSTGSFRLLTFNTKEELSTLLVPDGKELLKILADRLKIRCRIS